MRNLKRALGVASVAAFLALCLHAAQAATETAGAPRKLNMMVTELVNMDCDLYYGHGRGGTGNDAEGGAGLSVEFATPREGWVYAATTPTDLRYGKLYVALDPAPGEAARIVHEKAGETIESMRFLPAGKHRLVLRADLCGATVKVVVRAIPELAFIKYGYHPWNSAYGPYDWAYLQKNVLPDINVMVGCGVAAEKPFVESWKAQGRKWYHEVDSVGNPAYVKVSPSAETVFASMREFAGFKDPAYDGVLVDEFGEFCPTPAGFDEWSKVVGMFKKAEEFKGKTLNIYAYSGNFVAQESRKHFLETLIANGAKVYFERYLGESATQEAAADGIRSSLRDDLGLWEQAVPDCRRNVVMLMGYVTQNPFSLDFLPNVDFKVLMDMEARLLATDPAFDGLYGASFYTCGNADDECVRWGAQLFRHYFIEGNTNSLAEQYGFKYALDHIQNATLDEGVTGWDIQQAETKSVVAGELKGFGNMQGCYGGGDAIGSHHLLLKRSAKAPNVISQKVSNLQPGKLYSVKLFTVDHQDIATQSSKKQVHALSVDIEGAAVLKEKSFAEPTVGAQKYTRTLPDKSTVSGPLWVNMHFRVFRAEAPTATLRISDWASADAPGGPVGQDLMLNFIEVQPFFEK
jgi:hypothetical protein